MSDEYVKGRIALGEEIIAQACSRMARQFSKQGVPPSVRPSLWALMIEKEILDDYEYHVKKTIHVIKKEIEKCEHILDRVLIMESKHCQNDDNYFVFEDLIRTVLLYWSRDVWIKDQLNLEDTKERSFFPLPNGLFPVWGMGLYSMPLCYLYPDSSLVYMMFRVMYVKYFHRLHTLSDHPQGLLALCCSFEHMLKQADAKLFYYLSYELGISPIDVALKWIMFGFVGLLETEQVLLLWDRILGFDNLELLPLTAASLFLFKRDLLFTATSRKDVEVNLVKLEHF